MSDRRLLRRAYDAVIIGSGLGGSTLAYRLSRAGRSVLVVEAGEFLDVPARRPNDPIGLHIQSFTAKPSLVGGPTKFYGAAMYRLRERDFVASQHEAGESPNWPIGYRDIEPYYSEAEQLYHVHGDSEGDPTEPRRSIGYPYPPLPHAPRVSLLVDRLRASGTSVAAMPRALDYRPGGPCVLCPTCDAYYCRLDAKMDADIAALRPALATKFVELATRTECLRVLTNDTGSRAIGVIVRQDGTERQIYADVVAVCAGVPNSARLLLQSRSSSHPHGLGNSSGCVGRYLGGHTTGMVFPLLSGRKLPPMHTKTFAITSYYHGAPDWPYPTGIIQAAGQIPFWEADVVAPWKKPVAKIIGERSIYCFYMTEALANRESGFDLENPQGTRIRPPRENSKTFERLRSIAVDTFRRAGYRVVAPRHRSLWHTVGTVRFGHDTQTSVLNPDCRVHDIENLYVVDASVLPSAGAVNTGLTIAALALRAGDIIAGSKRHGSQDECASVH